MIFHWNILDKKQVERLHILRLKYLFILSFKNWGLVLVKKRKIGEKC